MLVSFSLLLVKKDTDSEWDSIVSHCFSVSFLAL